MPHIIAKNKSRLPNIVGAVAPAVLCHHVAAARGSSRTLGGLDFTSRMFWNHDWC
jgi:hypothetical protein